MTCLTKLCTCTAVVCCDLQARGQGRPAQAEPRGCEGPRSLGGGAWGQQAHPQVRACMLVGLWVTAEQACRVALQRAGSMRAHGREAACRLVAGGGYSLGVGLLEHQACTLRTSSRIQQPGWRHLKQCWRGRQGQQRVACTPPWASPLRASQCAGDRHWPFLTPLRASLNDTCLLCARSVLVANNGLAAVKFMRSVRSWASQVGKKMCGPSAMWWPRRRR